MEPEEIEAVLANAAAAAEGVHGVRVAVVPVCPSSGIVRLGAYVAAQGELRSQRSPAAPGLVAPALETALKEGCEAELPPYMIPQASN